MSISADDILNALDDLGLDPTQRISTLVEALEDDDFADTQSDSDDDE